MNYEVLPEYQVGTYIMKVPSDQFWPFTLHFRKVVTLVIQDLFKTKITSLANNCVSMSPTLIFIDENANRWIMTVKESADVSTMNQITMYFPRSNTRIDNREITQIPLEQLLDSAYLSSHNLAIITSDVKHRNNEYIKHFTQKNKAFRFVYRVNPRPIDTHPDRPTWSNEKAFLPTSALSRNPPRPCPPVRATTSLYGLSAWTLRQAQE